MIMKRIIAAIVLLAGVVLVTGCSSKEDAGSAPEPATGYTESQIRLAGIETGRIEKRILSSVVSCTGEIEVPPQGMASVTAPLGGYLEETVMVPGAYVTKGQRLATLTNPRYIELQQAYLETSGQLKFAEQDFVRQRMLQEQNATAEKKMQESESQFNVLKARRSGLRAQLRLIGVDVTRLEEGDIQPVVVLRAPINGYVTAVNHHPGAYVEPSEAIFELANLGDLHLHLNVFEQDIADVQGGQAIRFRPSGSAGDFYRGAVSLVSPKRHAEGQSFDVHGHIETGENKLKPGMFVEAEIFINADSVASLPQSALVYHANEAFVIIDENGDYTIQPVEPGVKMDGWVEIKNHAVLQNRQVVTRGASRLFAAMRRD